MATFQTWRGAEGDLKPSELVATVEADTSATKPERKTAIAQMRAVAETFVRDGSYVVVRNADTGDIAITIGRVPDGATFREARDSGLRFPVQITAAGAALPVDTWVPVQVVAIRRNADGTHDMRLAHRDGETTT